MGSEAIGSMCRSIAAWAEEVGKAKLDAKADDIQPIIDSIQVHTAQRHDCFTAFTALSIDSTQQQSWSTTTYTK